MPAWQNAPIVGDDSTAGEAWKKAPVVEHAGPTTPPVDLTQPIPPVSPEDAALAHESVGIGVKDPREAAPTVGQVINTPFVSIPSAPDPHYRSDIAATPSARTASAAAGVLNVGRDIVQGVETPIGAATLPFAGAPEAIQKVLSAAFGAFMVYQGVKSAPEAKRVISDPNSTLGQKIEAGGNELLDFTAAFFAGKHGIEGADKVTPEQRQQATTWLDNYVNQRKADVAGMPATAEALRAESMKPAEQAVPADSQGARPGGSGQSGGDGGVEGKAAELGITYNGQQEFPGHKPLHQFTDPQTGSTFALPNEATPAMVEGRLAEVRKEFGVDDDSGHAGISAGPGAAAKGQPGMVDQKVVSIKNAKVDEERAKRGELPLMAPARKAMGATWDEAMGEVEKDEHHGTKMVDDILNGHKKSISEVDHAVLLHETIRVMNERDMEAERAADPHASEDERVAAKSRWQTLENRVNDIDHATQQAGTITGRALQFRKALAADDFTLQAMERKARASKGGPLSEVERDQIKEQAQKISELQKTVEASRDAETRARAQAELTRTHEATIKELQDQAAGEKTKTSAVREVLKRGEKKVRTEATSTDIKARAKAEAVAGEGLNHKTVYDLARAHINEELAKGNKISGVEGEAATIKAVHADLSEYHPGLTEDQVREAYSEYGKVKFPSEAEDKVRLSEYRRIGQLDLQIKDLQKGLDAKRSGIQRDKATQAIRDLTKQRNDLLQKHAGPPSPERIASRDEAKQTALKNAIEDTDRELQTGIRVERAAGQPDSPTTERLRAELQAMRDKLKEIKDAENAPQDEANRLAKQQDAIKKQIAELEAKVGGKGPDTKGQNVNRPGHPALEPLMQQRDALRTQLADARAKQANAESLERKADQLRQQVEAKKAKLASGNLSTDPKAQRMNRPAATAEIEKAQQELDAVNKQLAEARKVVAGEEALQKELDKMNEDINSKTAKLKAGDLSTDPKAQRMNRPLPNQALEEAKQKLDDLNKQMSDARKAAHQASLGTPEERYNRTRQKAIAKQLEDVKARIASGKYERPAKKVPPAKTDATRRAEVQLALEKNKFTEGLLRKEKAARPPVQKTIQDISEMAKGFAISGYHSLIKIVGFDVAKLVEEPLHEAAGVVASKLTGSARGSLESGAGSAKSLGAYYKGFSRGVKEALGVYRTGRSDSDLLYGKARLTDAKWYDWIGSRLHGALKHTVFSAAEEKYRVNGFANAEKSGLDISNEFVRAAINKAAYDRAFSAKLQENNVVSNAVNMLHSNLEKANPDTGEPDITKQVVSSALKTFVTKGIIKTPANFVSQVMQRTPLGLVAGLGKLARGSWRGLDTLKPSEVDAIHALLKTGAVGSAMFIWGVIDATKQKKDRIFGGYYSPGRKPDDGDVEWGTIRVGGHTIPHVMAHNLLTEPAQMGSTMMRVAMERFNKKDEQSKGMLEGALYSIVALGAQAPVAGPILRMSSPGANLSGQVIQGLVPQLLANIAEDLDKNTERSPKTPLQQLEVQIPGLRKNVPARKKGYSNAQ